MLGELTLCLTLTRCKPIYLITSAQSRSFVAFALHRRVELPSCLVGLKLAAGGNQMRWVLLGLYCTDYGHTYVGHTYHGFSTLRRLTLGEADATCRTPELPAASLTF